VTALVQCILRFGNHRDALVLKLCNFSVDVLLQQQERDLVSDAACLRGDALLMRRLLI
jgi:hypothetical protein